MKEGGFTLIEMLISVAIMMAVVAGVFAVFNPSMGAFQAQPEVSDLQQRLRIGVTDIAEELLMAGAGTYHGMTTGPLTNILAPVLPYRAGTTAPDMAAGVTFRQDTVTVLYASGREGATSAPVLDPAGDIPVDTTSGCPPATTACGFMRGDRVLIFDESGGFDLFTVTAVAGSTLQHAMDRLSQPFTQGSRLAVVESHTFYLNSAPDTNTFQLMHYDGSQTDEPTIDDVVGLRFEYFGDPNPPALIRNAGDAEGPWTTYGPKPPVVGVDNDNDPWPAGENCVFSVANGAHVPRLSSLGAGSLVPLSQAQFGDGPWCPGLGFANRFDADLLRIRKIRVTLRIQTGESSLRGSNTALFTRPGKGADLARLVPDQQVQFDVTPRNINLSR